MLNHGDGTFGALTQYTAGPGCANNAIDVTLGDVTKPAAIRDRRQARRLRRLLAERRAPRGRRHGRAGSPAAFNLGVAPNLGPGRATCSR